MTYHIPAPPDREGVTELVPHCQSGLRWMNLKRILLGSPGDACEFSTGDDEVGLDLLVGACRITLAGPWGDTVVENVRRIPGPLNSGPNLTYIPRATHVTLTCQEGPLHAVMAGAQSRQDFPPRQIDATAASPETFGGGNMQRLVYPALGLEIEADRLVMGETHVPSGHWSSYPPHKHDEDRPPESVSEEIYHFYVEPSFGVGVQLLWTPDSGLGPALNEAYLLHSGDTVVIPRGYHPNAVAPGCRMVTIWAYAGDRRTWGEWAADPRFIQLLTRAGNEIEEKAG
jgi:5-deoxy-glucuronate isomerase